MTGVLSEKLERYTVQVRRDGSNGVECVPADDGEFVLYSALSPPVTADDLVSFAETVSHIREGDFYADYDRAIAALEPLERILYTLTGKE